MATMQELTIKRREGSGKAFSKRLRREGTVPAVLYDGKKAESVTVDPKAVLRMSSTPTTTSCRRRARRSTRPRASSPS